MAGHVKLTRSAAKAGVTIALLALLAAVAGNAMGQGTGATPPPRVPITRSALKLKLNGLSPVLKHDLTQIQGPMLNFIAVSKLMEHEGIFYYFKHTVVGHRLLTVDDANAKFLPIADANAKFLPIADANARFLPIADANAKYLQGVSEAATLSRSTQRELLSIPGVEVDAATNLDGFPSVTINNSTGIALPAVQDQGGTDAGITLQPGTNSLTLTLPNGVDQLRLQTFPASNFNRVLTLTLSIDFNSAQASSSFAGQLINGGT